MWKYLRQDVDQKPELLNVWQDKRYIVVEGNSNSGDYYFVVVDHEGKSKEFQGTVTNPDERVFSVNIDVVSLSQSISLVPTETLVVYTGNHSAEIIFEEFIDIGEIPDEAEEHTKSLSIVCSGSFSITKQPNDGGLNTTTYHEGMREVDVGDLEPDNTVVVNTTNLVETVVVS
jgi:hypothetical protein